MEKQFLIVNGYGRGKVYSINRDYLKVEEEADLTDDELKIIEFIKENGSINNRLSREKLGFSKDKNITLFKSLLNKQLITKEGSGNSVKYSMKTE